MRPIYERYRSVKRLLSNPQNTQSIPTLTIQVGTNPGRPQFASVSGALGNDKPVARNKRSDIPVSLLILYFLKLLRLFAKEIWTGNFAKEKFARVEKFQSFPGFWTICLGFPIFSQIVVAK